MVSLPGRGDGHPAGTVGARHLGRLRLQHWEAEAPNAIMGWTVFQPRREQWIRQRYQLAPPESLRSRPQLENSAAERVFLRKVGGGYVFTHRLLVEYFATLQPTDQARQTQTA